MHDCVYKESKREVPAAPLCTSEDAEQHRSRHEVRTREVQALVAAMSLSGSSHSLLHCPALLDIQRNPNSCSLTLECSPPSIRTVQRDSVLRHLLLASSLQPLCTVTGPGAPSSLSCQGCQQDLSHPSPKRLSCPSCTSLWEPPCNPGSVPH